MFLVSLMQKDFIFPPFYTQRCQNILFFRRWVQKGVFVIYFGNFPSLSSNEL
jgi:hypothetical protein